MRRRAWARIALCAIAAMGAAVMATSTAIAAPTCTDTWIGGHDSNPVSEPNNWGDGANWSAGVPGAPSDVCVESGAPVIYTGTQLPSSIAALDIGSSSSSGATAALTLSIGEVVHSGSTTVGPAGTLTLNGTYNGASAGNAALGGGPVDNRGTIIMEGTGYSATLFGAILNQGTIDVPYGTVAFCQGGNGGTGSVDNQGTISVAAPSASEANAPATVQVTGCSITDDDGGAIVNDGTFDVFGSNGTTATYTQGSGTETGNPIGMGQQAALAYTGTGASSVNVPVGLTMSGNLAAGQQLTVDIGTTVTEASSFTNAGSILLNGTYEGSGGGPAGLAVSSGTFTNAGTLTADSGTAVDGTVVNDGTVAVEPGSLLELESGSFTNAPSGTFAPQISSTQTGVLQIDVGTAFTAGGTLAPELEGGFIPTTGQEFDTLATRGGSYSGTFATVTGNWHADDSTDGYIGSVYGAAPAPAVPGPANPAPATPAPATPAPATPAPVTPAPTASRVAPKVSGLHGGNDLIEAQIKCAASAESCHSYSVVASVTEHLKGRKLVAITALKRKITIKRVTVAAFAGSLKPGRSVTLKLTLNAAGRALLRRYGKLKVSVVISAGAEVLRRETVTVKAAVMRR